MTRKKLGIIGFLRLCELIGEIEALHFLEAIGTGAISVEAVEKLIYINESKEQFKKRLETKLNKDSTVFGVHSSQTLL